MGGQRAIWPSATRRKIASGIPRRAPVSFWRCGPSPSHLNSGLQQPEVPPTTLGHRMAGVQLLPYRV
jgi:hypothetical protein